MAEPAKSPTQDEDTLPAKGETAPRRPWRAYFEADLGFRNHWYPALFSGSSLKASRGQAIRRAMLFKRIDGKVYGVEDRCLHRGVPFSVRPECHTKNTISCWYHGFTYDVRDGKLVAIIPTPESPLIGRAKIKAYRVEERKNMVFAYHRRRRAARPRTRPAAGLPR